MKPRKSKTDNAINERIGQILDLLKGEYGVPRWQARYDPILVLVQTILSQNTSDANSRRALRSLLDFFHSWEDVVGADADTMQQNGFWRPLDWHGRIRSMKENSYDQLDDLFKEIRLRLVLVRQSAPATADDLKGLVAQLEYWVESLVVDSLKLRSLESGPKRATEPQKGRRKRPGKT